MNGSNNNSQADYRDYRDLTENKVLILYIKCHNNFNRVVFDNIKMKCLKNIMTFSPLLMRYVTRYGRCVQNHSISTVLFGYALFWIKHGTLASFHGID